MSVILIFETEDERLKFNSYVYRTLDEKELEKLCYVPATTGDLKNDKNQHDIEVGKYLKEKLEGFRHKIM